MPTVDVKLTATDTGLAAGLQAGAAAALRLVEVMQRLEATTAEVTRRLDAVVTAVQGMAGTAATSVAASERTQASAVQDATRVIVESHRQRAAAAKSAADQVIATEQAQVKAAGQALAERLAMSRAASARAAGAGGSAPRGGPTDAELAELGIGRQWFQQQRRSFDDVKREIQQAQARATAPSDIYATQHATALAATTAGAAAWAAGGGAGLAARPTPSKPPPAPLSDAEIAAMVRQSRTGDQGWAEAQRAGLISTVAKRQGQTEEQARETIARTEAAEAIREESEALRKLLDRQAEEIRLIHQATAGTRSLTAARAEISTRLRFPNVSDADVSEAGTLAAQQALASRTLAARARRDALIIGGVESRTLAEQLGGRGRSTLRDLTEAAGLDTSPEAEGQRLDFARRQQQSRAAQLDQDLVVQRQRVALLKEEAEAGHTTEQARARIAEQETALSVGDPQRARMQREVTEEEHRYTAALRENTEQQHRAAAAAREAGAARLRATQAVVAAEREASIRQGVLVDPTLTSKSAGPHLQAARLGLTGDERARFLSAQQSTAAADIELETRRLTARNVVMEEAVRKHKDMTDVRLRLAESDARVATGSDAVATAFGNASRHAAELEGKLGGAGGGGLRAAIGNMADRIFRLSLVIAGFATLRAIGKAVSDIAAFNQQAEDARLGIAATVTVAGQFVDVMGRPLPLVEQLAKGLERGSAALRLMEEDSVRLAVPVDKLVQAYTIIAGQAAGAGFGLRESVTATEGLLVLAQRTGIPLTTLGKTIDNLFLGYRSAQTMIGRLLQLDDQQIQRAIQKNELQDLFLGKLKTVIALQEQEARGTLTGIEAILASQLRLFAVDVGGGAFEVLKKHLLDVADGLGKLRADPEQLTTLRTGISGIATVADQLARALEQSAVGWGFMAGAAVKSLKDIKDTWDELPWWQKALLIAGGPVGVGAIAARTEQETPKREQRSVDAAQAAIEAGIQRAEPVVTELDRAKHAGIMPDVQTLEQAQDIKQLLEQLKTDAQRLALPTTVIDGLLTAIEETTGSFKAFSAANEATILKFQESEAAFLAQMAGHRFTRSQTEFHAGRGTRDELDRQAGDVFIAEVTAAQRKEEREYIAVHGAMSYPEALRAQQQRVALAQEQAGEQFQGRLDAIRREADGQHEQSEDAIRKSTQASLGFQQARLQGKLEEARVTGGSLLDGEQALLENARQQAALEVQHAQRRLTEKLDVVQQEGRPATSVQQTEITNLQAGVTQALTALEALDTKGAEIERRELERLQHINDARNEGVRQRLSAQREIIASDRRRTELQMQLHQEQTRADDELSVDPARKLARQQSLFQMQLRALEDERLDLENRAADATWGVAEAAQSPHLQPGAAQGTAEYERATNMFTDALAKQASALRDVDDWQLKAALAVAQHANAVKGLEDRYVNLGATITDSLARQAGELAGGGLIGGLIESTIQKKVKFDLILEKNLLEYIPGLASKGGAQTGSNFVSQMLSKLPGVGQYFSGGTSQPGGVTQPTSVGGGYSGGNVDQTIKQVQDAKATYEKVSGLIAGGGTSGTGGTSFQSLMNMEAAAGAGGNASVGAIGVQGATSGGTFTAVNQYGQMFSGPASQSGTISNVAGGGSGGSGTGAGAAAALAAIIGTYKGVRSADEYYTAHRYEPGITQGQMWREGNKRVIAEIGKAYLGELGGVLGTAIGSVLGEMTNPILKLAGIGKIKTTETFQKRGLYDLFTQLGIPGVTENGRALNLRLPGTPGGPSTPLPADFLALQGAGVGAGTLFASTYSKGFGRGGFSPGNIGVGVLNNAAALGLSAEDARKQIEAVTRAYGGQDLETAIMRLQLEQIRGRNAANTGQAGKPFGISIEEESKALGDVIRAYTNLPLAIDAATVAQSHFAKDGKVNMEGLKRVVEDTTQVFGGIPAALQSLVETQSPLAATQAIGNQFFQTALSRFSERLLQTPQVNNALTQAVALIDQAATLETRGDHAGARKLMADAVALERQGAQFVTTMLQPIAADLRGLQLSVTGGTSGGIINQRAMSLDTPTFTRVPGPIGSPMPAIVHGGEPIRSPVQEDKLMSIMVEIRDALSRGQQISVVVHDQTTHQVVMDGAVVAESQANRRRLNKVGRTGGNATLGVRR